MSNAVSYAEQVLGVHIPWKEAEQKLSRHEEISKQLASIRSVIKNIKSSIEDRKLEIQADAPSRPDWPTTQQAQSSALKVLYHVDDPLDELTDQLNNKTLDLENLEREQKHIELVLHVLTARMNSLGGLLQFYAVAKQTTLHRGEVT